MKILIVENDTEYSGRMALELMKAGHQTTSIPESSLKDMPPNHFHMVYMNSSLRRNHSPLGALFYTPVGAGDNLLLSISYGRDELGTYKPAEFVETWMGARI